MSSLSGAGTRNRRAAGEIDALCSPRLLAMLELAELSNMLGQTLTSG
jgi:hypothetical protein